MDIDMRRLCFAFDCPTYVISLLGSCVLGELGPLRLPGYIHPFSLVQSIHEPFQRRFSQSIFLEDLYLF
jgi:hypothetical protein